ncbi:MAG: hypothetical protein K6T73_06635 [Candidatus Bathyarchaeota archaeon]|nr:hypothetical protein [Candidatus Bathyarchaeota archaeon]
MIIWDIIKWLSEADILGQSGLNVVTLTIFCCMLIYGAKTAYKHLNPFSVVKIPMLITMSIFPLIFYYQMLDMISGMIAFLMYGNPLYLWTFLAVVGLPFSTIIVIYLWKYFKCFNFKVLLVLIPLQIITILASIAIFGTYNMRNLMQPYRAEFYLCSMLPMWTVWAIGWTKFWKRPKGDEHGKKKKI